MIFRLFVVILAIGSVHCDCTSTIIACTQTLGSQVQSGITICTALRSYIRCFSPECNFGSTYGEATFEDEMYNNILNGWRKIGINCDSTWNEIAHSFQDGSLLYGSGIAGLTTPRNSADSYKKKNFIVFILISFFVRLFV